MVKDRKKELLRPLKESAEAEGEASEASDVSEESVSEEDYSGEE